MTLRYRQILAAHAALSGLLAALCLLAVQAAKAQTAASERPQEEIQMGISVDTVPVTSAFAGGQIAVFGTIENPSRIAQTLNEYSIIVTVTGPIQDIVVRRKERVFGIWINRQSRIYRAIPTFYAVASNRSLQAIAPPEILKANQIGIDNQSFNLYSSGGQTFILPAPEFAGSLRRIRREEGLFTEDKSGVVFLGSSLFRATLSIPSNVPIGQHKVSAYLFRNGELLASRTGSFQVERAGFEKLMYTLAHDLAFWYGVIAVLAALATGWLASVIFGGNRK